jgi:aspartyl-tRNA(Asn)/glutamyl-tRNA(Gln) amidotransferase subunit B
MRGKESAHDYLYFAEPDLPPVRIDAAYLAQQRALLPEMPAARRARYAAEWSLPEKDAAALTHERVVADFFEAVVRIGAKPKEAANWVLNDMHRLVGDAELGYGSFAEIALKPSEVAAVIALVAGGTIQTSGGRTLLRAIAKTGKSAKTLVQELGLEQVQDTAQIERWCREALIGKDKVVADVRAGNANAINALLGPVMKASGGKANAQLVRETLLRLMRQE